MLITNTKARNVIISDLRDRPKFLKYINDEKGEIIKPVKALWKRQRDEVTKEAAEKIIQSGGLPAELLDKWRTMIIDFVENDLTAEWIKSIKTAGDRIARRVNKIQYKQFDFNEIMQSVKEWIDTEGGRLIVDLTAGQYTTANALIQNQITWGVTSPYLMAQRIKPIIGLTNREAAAVNRFMVTLMGEGVPASILNAQVDQYSKFLHNNRAFRIARTEISNSYNFGQLDSVRQARDAGWLPGEPEKNWIAGGQAPCDICLDNEGDGPLATEQLFSSGHDHPTAHPNCECSVGYSIRR